MSEGMQTIGEYNFQLGLALIPGIEELSGLGLALNEERAFAGVLKQIAQGTTKGRVFENYGGQLPAKAYGYYKEYTVPLAGKTGRGAARLIKGDGGELFYTLDHYTTLFRFK